MKKNECNIVRDLMPLVLDRVASDESREMVEEHITACGECRKQYEDMKAEMPEETRTEFEEDQAQFISAVRKVRKQKRKRRIIALVTAAVICFLAAACGCMLYDRLRLQTDQPIPVAEYELILSRLKDGRTAMTFRADKTYSSTAYNERMETEDGKKIMYEYMTTSMIHEIYQEPMASDFGALEMDGSLQEIRRGTPEDYVTVWKRGDAIPDASEEMNAWYEMHDKYWRLLETETRGPREDEEMEDLDFDMDKLYRRVPEWQTKREENTGDNGTDE